MRNETLNIKLVALILPALVFAISFMVIQINNAYATTQEVQTPMEFSECVEQLKFIDKLLTGIADTKFASKDDENERRIDFHFLGEGDKETMLSFWCVKKWDDIENTLILTKRWLN